MTALLAQCPHCQTSFRVSSSQLKVANGQVRCGACLGVFSAISNEIRIKPPEGYLVEEVVHDDDFQEQEIDNVEEAIAATPHVPLTEEIPTHVNVEQPPQFTEQPEGYKDLAEENADTDDIFEIQNLNTPVHEPEPATKPVKEFQAHSHEVEPSLGNLSLEELLYEDSEQDAPVADEELEEATTEDFEPPFFDDEPESTLIDSSTETAETEKSDFEETPASASPTPSHLREDKQEIRRSLTQLNQTEELAPVDEEDLAALDAEPITLQHHSYFHARITSALLIAANLLLVLALPLPWLYVHKDELATHPRFHFLAPMVCRFVECIPIATTSNTSSLYSQQLLVRTHPTIADALEVSFVFHNGSAQPQPFPDLELAFSNVSNQLMANRLFKPTEYLPPELAQGQTMPGQSSVQVQLSVADPGAEAVNYKVVLHAHTP